MKFFCEYCGCRIDADKDDKCPNCGASYKQNKTFLEQQKKRQDLENTAIEFGNTVFNHAKSTMKFSKAFLLLPILVFVIVFLTIIFNFINMNNRSNKLDNITTGQSTTVEKEENVTVSGLNKYAKAAKYQVKVTGYNKETDYFYHPKKGYEYITFNLVVENLSSDSISSEDVNCIVDGVAQTNYRTSGYSTLPFSIKSNLAVKGDVTFEVPIDATSYDIRYGDYVTIHIEK